MAYIILLVGFVLLVKGADFFVDGSSSIAKIFKIPTLIIGLTIVAFGTSAPELAVSITAALQGKNDIVLGNVIGSNIFNLLAVVGVAACISPLLVKKSIIVKEFPFLLMASFVLLVLSFDMKYQGYTHNLLSQADGIIFIVLFGIFMYYLIELALTSRDEVQDDIVSMPLSKSLIYSAIGLAGIVFGGNAVVNSASDIARSLGMSENLVGLTIVSLGTSLPEFVTSIVAARKGQSDIALGNVIGSNVFNILLVLGVSAFITPIAVNSAVFFDLIVMLVATIIAYIFAATSRKIKRSEGILLTLMYVAYFIYIIIRN